MLCDSRHELLLTEAIGARELSMLDEIGAFNRTGGGKGPTRATLPLALDGAHTTVGDPVNFSRECLALVPMDCSIGEP